MPFFLAKSLIENLIKVQSKTKNTNDDFVELINKTFRLIVYISKEKAPNSFRKEIIDYCIKEFDLRNHFGTPWYLAHLQVASEITDNEEEINMVINALNEYDNKGGNNINVKIFK